MNSFTKELFFSFALYSIVAGLITCVFSVFSRLVKKKKISLPFVCLRFLKGFAAIALACAYIYVDMKYGLTAGSSEKSVSSSAGNALLGILGLAAPVVIVVVVHKITKAIENKHGI